MGKHKSKSPKRKHRSRSRDHDRDRNRDDKRDKHSKSSSRRSDSREREQRSKDVQKGIDAAKNRMRAALSSAANSVRNEPSSSQPTQRPSYDITSTLDTLDVNRQNKIDLIEESGFKPGAFKSTSGGAGGRVKKQDDRTDHEKAMFGSQWQSKSLLSKATKKEKEPSPSEADASIPTISKPDIPLAHESLSADPVARQEKWLKLFLERRQALLEADNQA